MDRVKVMNMAKMELMDPPVKNPNNSPVFYSSILFSLKLDWTERISTAAVDGKTLFINENWFCGLGKRQRVGLLAHEVLHIGFRHIDYFHDYNRKVYCPDIEHRLWNEAGDHVINLALINAGYELPPKGLWDDRFKGMATFQVYYILHDEYTANPGTPFPFEGDILYPTDNGTAQSQRDIATLQKAITTILTKAKISSEMARENPGNAVSSVLRDLKERTHPRLPFEIILANYMSAYAQDDFSYRRPNRRFMPDYYLPGAFSERLCNLCCAFDVSGSVTEKQLTSFRNAIRILKEELKPDKITLIEWDTQIKSESTVTESTNIMDIKFHNGGGTRVQPLIDWIIVNKPEVTLVFTDGEFRTPDFKDINTDVIWLIEGDSNWKTTYGRVFYYTL